MKYPVTTSEPPQTPISSQSSIGLVAVRPELNIFGYIRVSQMA